MDRLAALLAERGSLLLDGAMGTELWARGIRPDRCLEELNLSDPTLVRSVHAAYIKAGADVIETNTFGANRFRLGEHHLEERVAEINGAGVRIAIEARNSSDRPILVAGSVGPLGRPLEPIGAIKVSSAERSFGEQVESLAAAGADLLVLETFASLLEVETALRIARMRAPELAVIALMSFDDDGDAGILASLLALGASAVGFNCGSGPEAGLRMARSLGERGLGPVAVVPNAGLPQRVGGRLVYAAGADYFGRLVPQFLQAGVAIIGGCCGTSPAHIAAMRLALDAEHVGMSARWSGPDTPAAPPRGGR